MSIQYKSDYAVAYLDLLGFKEFVKEDLQASLQLLLDVQQTAEQAISDAANFPPENYSNTELAKLAEDNQISSFEVFLPISDSIIILSHDPSLMVRQLSNYLSNCFGLTSHIYAQAKGGTDPSRIIIPTVRMGNSGKVESDEEPTHWYPKLFRGGLSYGDVTLTESQVYVEGKTHNFFNVVGKSYVEAVRFEQCKLKGPRLFCSEAFFDTLDDSTRRFVVPVVNGGGYEVLWPALQFSESGDPEIEKYQFAELYQPVKALSKYYKSHRAAAHYHQYEILWARSTIRYFAIRGREDLGWSLVSTNFSKRVIQDMSNKRSWWNIRELWAMMQAIVCKK